MQQLERLAAEISLWALATWFVIHARLTQQNGFLHAGVITSILDSACGYAAYSVALNVATC